jgi:hypothetical protein
MRLPAKLLSHAGTVYVRVVLHIVVPSTAAEPQLDRHCVLHSSNGSCRVWQHIKSSETIQNKSKGQADQPHEPKFEQGNTKGPL